MLGAYQPPTQDIVVSWRGTYLVARLWRGNQMQSDASNLRCKSLAEAVNSSPKPHPEIVSDSRTMLI